MARAKTVEELEKHGLDTTPDEVDKEVAAVLATAFAQEPDKTSPKVTHKRAAKLTPPSITVSYPHSRAHETVLDLVCRFLLDIKNLSPMSLK